MAKKNEVYIDIVIDDKGTTKRVAVDAGKLGIQLDKAANASEKGAKKADKLSKSQKNLDRNMRGTAKMSGNTTKEFSKMSQGMGGLVGAYATLAAQVFAVSAAFQFLSSASDFRNLVAGQEAMGAVTGRTYKSMTANIIAATDAQLKYGDAAKAAAIGAAAGLTAGQLTDLGTAAKNASYALGRDLTDSFNRLIRGVTKAEPELLDELGIILRLESATEKYAQKIGVLRTELSAYQRTQAVTNEVQEQALQKFGAIEALMSDDAAALAQFTKSFDELSNTIKVGLIDGLTPGLKFLSENTMALVATLTLLAIPIVKAIIPSMDGWIVRSEKLERVQRIAAIKRGKRQKEEIKMMKRVGKTNKELLDIQQQGAQTTAQSRFGGGKQGSGLGFITGTVDGARGQQEARKLLDDAQAQFDEHGEIRKGKLQQYSKEELAQAEETYEQKVRTVEQGESQINKKEEHGRENKKKGDSKTTKRWKGFTNGLVKWAGKAARGVNIAFGAIAIFGILAMAYEGVKKLIEVLNPLSKQQKQDGDTVKMLTEKYTLLNEELERNANARKNILSGGAELSNIGQSVQGIDVESLMKELDLYNAMADKAKDSERGKNALFGLQASLGHLVELDSGFERLQKRFGDGLTGDLVSELAEGEDGMIALADKIVGVAQAIDGFATQKSDMDSRMTKFFKLTQNSVVSDIVDKVQDTIDIQERARDAILARIETAEEGASVEMLAETKLHSLKLHQIEVLEKRQKEIYNSSTQLGGTVMQEALDNNEKLIEYKALVKAIESQVGFILEENVERKLKSLQTERDLLATREEEIAQYQVIKAAFVEAEGNEKARDTAIVKRRTAQAKLQTQGLTIEGKIVNLGAKRITAQEKLDKLTNDVATAQLQVDFATTATQVSSEEQLTLAEALKEEGLAQFVLTLKGLSLEEKKLQLSLDNLAVLKAQNDLMVARGVITRREALGQAESGGSISTKKALRQVKGESLKNAAETAANDFLLAQKNYNLTLESMMEERIRVNGGKPLTATQEQGVATQANLGLSAASETSLDATHQLALHNAVNKAIVDTNQAKIEGLQHDADSAGLLGKAKIFADLRRQAVLANPEWKGTAAQNAQLDIQATKMQELTVLASQKQQLADAIQGGMETAFMSIIDGSKSAKEAFADMAKSILAAIAKMIVQALVLKMLQTALPSLFGADGGTTPGATNTGSSIPVQGFGGVVAKKGGMFGPGYAAGGYSAKKNNFSRGGMARGAQAGYAATLHGNEAVVPLPDNRSIPVTLNGAGGQNNNVTVNVAMDSSGNNSQSSQQDGAQAGKLGNIIASAVQQELQFQKRSGGILNPYGVS